MKLLIAAVLVCAVMAPALAYSQGASITAEDNRWVSSAGGTDLTITQGTTVEFAYPTGNSSHTLAWTSTAKGTCKDVPTSFVYANGLAPWKGTCTFADAGTYTFRCNFHDFMTGTIKVLEPAPSSTPTASATPSPSPTSDGGTTTTPGTTQPPPNQNETTQVTTAPAVKLAAKQKGTRIRGSVTNAQGRLEVTVKLNKRRVGRVTKTVTGTTTFSVTLDAKARKELKRRRSLKLSVTVAVAGRTERHTVRLTST